MIVVLVFMIIYGFRNFEKIIIGIGYFLLVYKRGLEIYLMCGGGIIFLLFVYILFCLMLIIVYMIVLIYIIMCILIEKLYVCYLLYCICCMLLIVK